MGATWHILGASVTGTSHLRTGRGCDDAHAYRICSDDLVLLAAADGAGSARHSALGSATAVQKALDVAEAMLMQEEPEEYEQWMNVLVGVFQEVHNALTALVTNHTFDHQFTQVEVFDEMVTQEQPVSLRDLSTTLLFVAVTRYWLAVAQIGDGGVIVRYADGSIASLTPRTDQVHLDETDFITDIEYQKYSHYTVQARDTTEGVALLTDGLQMIAMNFPDNTAHAPFFAPLFKFAARADANEAELRQFLESERLRVRTDDDKTLLLAVYQ